MNAKRSSPSGIPIDGRLELSSRFFAMAPHKAGSTMFFGYIKAICKMLDLRNVSFPDFVWSSGGDLRSACYSPAEADAIYRAPIVYWGNREAIRTLSGAFLEDAYTLLMIRDPRDCLVSMFYSFLGSHVPPGDLSGERKDSWLNDRKKRQEQADIDTYVLERASAYCERVREMISFAERTGRYQIIRYEDYIQDKVSLCWRIHDILAGLKRERASARWNLAFLEIFRFPGWRAAAIKRIASKLDVMPTTERPDQHVRRALPGDHRTKLRASTIGRLNDIFGSILTTYSYHVPSDIDR